MTATIGQPAPEWQIAQWLNCEAPIKLGALRGSVVCALAFQMLCPGCVSHAIPQLRNLDALFTPMGIVVVGLHTVFEHHEAMPVRALQAFLHEYRVTCPIGVDQASTSGAPQPRTMSAYGMQGTPTLLLIDRQGILRQQVFGHVPDLQLGAEIMRLALAPLARETTTQE